VDDVDDEELLSVFRAFATFGAGATAVSSPPGKVSFTQQPAVSCQLSSVIVRWQSASRGQDKGHIGCTHVACISKQLLSLLLVVAQAVEMDGARFAKLCRETGVQVSQTSPFPEQFCVVTRCACIAAWHTTAHRRFQQRTELAAAPACCRVGG
jgi:hypothetical protein